MSASREFSEADVLRLAEAFRQQVRADVLALCHPDSIAEIDDRNDQPAYVGCDAAHDFVDANESMAEAFLAAIGSEPDMDDDDTLDLINDAWGIAKRHGYGDPRPITKRT